MKPMPIRISELAPARIKPHAGSDKTFRELDKTAKVPDKTGKDPVKTYTKPLNDVIPEAPKPFNPESQKGLAEKIEADNIRTRMQVRDKELGQLEKQASLLDKASDEKYAEKLADIQRRIEELKEQNRLDKSAFIGIWNNRLDIFA